MFPIFDTIWPTFTNLNQLCIFNSTYFWPIWLTFFSKLDFPIKFDSSFLIQFYSSLQIDSTATTSIWLNIYDSTRLSCLILFNAHCIYLTHHFGYDSIQLSISDSIWINNFYSILLSFPILFFYNYIHSTHCLKSNSALPIQFESSYPIWFRSAFLIQFDSVIPFDLTHTLN